jgi:hypothetical protein
MGSLASDILTNCDIKINMTRHVALVFNYFPIPTKFSEKIHTEPQRIEMLAIAVALQNYVLNHECG